jgi:hypothetical protein
VSSADEVAERALHLADQFIDASARDLLEMAGGDAEVLFRASQIVRRHSTGGPALQHSAEHLAFSLLAAAHEVVRQEAEEKPHPQDG